MNQKQAVEKNDLNKQNEKSAMNSISQSVKPENQNQRHNTKKVSLGPNTKR
nr:hypothetical protein [uncultured Caproiciproducens sp.]